MASRGSMTCSLQLAVLVSAAIALGFGVRAGEAQLSSEYYGQTCPVVHRVARRVLKKAHEADVRIYASLTRLHFHDCFVQVRSSRPRARVPQTAGHDAARARALALPTRRPCVRSEPASACVCFFRAATAPSCWTTARASCRRSSPRPTTTRRAGTPWSTPSRRRWRRLAQALSPALTYWPSPPRSRSNW
jgi:hypothetical protein